MNVDVRREGHPVVIDYAGGTFQNNGLIEGDFSTVGGDIVIHA